MLKSSLKLTAKTLVLLLIPAAFLFIETHSTEAAVGLSVGNTGLNLLQAENLFYGNVGSTSHASSSFLLFQNNSVDRLRIDILGNLTTSGTITAGAFSGPITGGSISAANVSAGNFGSNVGNGNFSFPGNVGVGTTNPLGLLHIYSTASSSQALFIANNGYVGIGRNNPGFRLDVQGDTYIQGSLYNWGNASIQTLALGYGAAYPAILTTQTANEDLTIDPAGVGNIIMQGNVGIGTTNPLATLDILHPNSAAGGIRLQSSLDDLTLKRGRIKTGHYNNSEEPVTLLITSNSSGENLIALGGSSTVENSANTISFYTGETAATLNGTERMRINSAGNVGIGTTNPTAKLYVNGTSIFNDIATFTQPVVVSAPILGPHAATKSYVDSTIASATSSIATLWGGTIGGNVWNLNSGNVGIGNNNPLAKLQINNQGAFNAVIPGPSAYYGLHFNGQTTADYATGITWNGGTTGTQAGLYVQGSGAYGTKMYFATTQSYATGAQTRMMIDHSGNVGIGTTTPGTRLTVIGSGNYSIDAGNYRIGNIAAPVSANDAVNLSYLQSAVGTAQNAYWNLSGSTLSASSTTWNVRVGTTTAGTDKIGVAGGRISTLDTSDIYAGGQVNSAGTGANAFAGRLAVGQIAVATPKFFVNGGAAIGTNYSTANIATGTMALETNLGIGLTNPTARLHVFDPTTTTGYNTYLYNNGITSGTMLGLVQASSTFNGIGLYMNFQSGTGTSTANFADFRINNSQRFAVNYRGGITSTYANDADNVNLNSFTLTSGNASAASYNALAVSSPSRLIVSQTSATEDELFDNNYEGFKFNSGTYNNMGGFYVRMRRGTTTPVNAGGAYFRAHIYTDNGGQPGTNVTNSPSIYVARLGTTYADYYFPLSVALTANTNYWILLYKVGGFNAADQVYFYTHPTSGSAEWAYGNGTSWSVDPTRRGYFRVYSRSANGITATSDVNYGVYGSSTFGTGVRGASNAGIGVYGVSTHGYGGQFDSGLGLYNVVNGPSASAIYNFTALQRTGQRFLDYTYNLGYTGDIFNINSGSNVYTVHYLYYNGSAFTDYTNAARNFGGSAYPLLADSDDYFYFGRTSATTAYRNLFFDISNTPNLSGVTWEYASGADGSNNCIWTPFVPTTDETNGLLRDGMVTPGGMSLAACTVNGIASRYWMRVRASSVTTGVNAYASSFGYFGGYFARYYSSDIERFRVYNNGTTYAAGPIYPGTTDVEDGVQTSRYIYDAGTLGIGLNTSLNVSGTATFTQPIIVGTPLVATHAATKSYVDGLIGGATSTGLWTLSGNNLFASSTAWNVGIGTAAPVSKFTVFGANPRLSVTHNVLNAGDTGIDFILNPTMTVERKNAIIVNAAGSYGRGNMFFVLDSASDSNNYDIAADTKMAILNNGNVGIGTTNPIQRLNIVGTSVSGVGSQTNISAFVNNGLRIGGSISNSSQDAITYSSGGGGGGAAIVFGRGGNYDTFISLYTNPSSTGPAGAIVERLRINSDGNVGIGITNPGFQTEIQRMETVNRTTYNDILAVTANANTNPYSGHGGGIVFRGTTYRSGSGNVNYARIGSTLNDHSVSSAGSDLFFDVSPLDDGVLSRAMTIKYSGNVGIGTTTIDSRLSVSGGNIFINDAAITSGTPKAAITKEYLDSALAVTQSAYWNLSGSNLFASSTSWNVGIGTTNPVGKLQLNSNWTANPGGTNTIYMSNSGFASSNLAAQQIITSDTSNTSPGASIGLALHNTNTTAGAYAPMLVFSKRETGASAYNSAIAAIGARTVTGSGSSDSWIDGDLMFYTAPTSGNGLLERMRISQNGNLGIGTTNPQQTLHISGAAEGSYIAGRIENTAVSGAADFDFKNSAQMWKMGVNVSNQFRIRDDSNSANVLMIESGAGANAFYIKSGGNVGIGTTTPAAKLSVSGGNTFINDAAITSGTPKAAITKEYLDSALAVTQSAYWNLSGSNLYASSTSWNIGIGTASPGGKLEIKTASNDVLKLNRDGWVGGEEANILFSHNGTYNAKIGSWVEGGGSMVALRFFTVDAGAQSQKMVIRGNGNVGIGTTNPSSKFNVIAENDGDGIVIRRNAATDGNYADLRFSLTTSDTYNGATFIRTYRGPGGSGDNDMLFNVGGNNALMIKDSGKIGIGTTTPDSDKIVTIWGGNLILKDAIIGAGSDAQLAATKGYVDSVINALPSGIASFVTSTPVAYNGSRGGYSSANALCSALVAGSHVCTAEEILQTINSGATANIPTSTTLWINNGPPGYTVNANDCIGWTDAGSTSFAPVWVKLASGDGFGALDRCNSTRRYACCK